MSWTANIPPEEMAVSLCDDLLKKMGQLRNMPPEKSGKILEGVIDGLLNHTLPHPYEGLPDYLKSMEPDYVVGHGVGMTWQRVARQWREAYDNGEIACDLSLRLRAKGEAMRDRMRRKGVEPLPDEVQSQTLRDCEPNAGQQASPPETPEPN